VSNDRETRIRMRAYEIWQGQGRPVGRAVEHWVEAERQLDEEDLRVLAGFGKTQCSDAR